MLKLLLIIFWEALTGVLQIYGANNLLGRKHTDLTGIVVLQPLEDNTPQLGGLTASGICNIDNW